MGLPDPAHVAALVTRARRGQITSSARVKAACSHRILSNDLKVYLNRLWALLITKCSGGVEGW